jgi:cytochrome c
MKKHFVIWAPALILLLTTGFIWTGSMGGRQESGKTGKGIQIPANLGKVFTNSCMPCHSTNGKKMAKALLNFSKWDKYGRGTQMQKGKAIGRLINKGSMPPAQFIESSPELALTLADKDNIRKWINSMNEKKDQ